MLLSIMNARRRARGYGRDFGCNLYPQNAGAVAPWNLDTKRQHLKLGAQLYCRACGNDRSLFARPMQPVVP